MLFTRLLVQQAGRGAAPASYVLPWPCCYRNQTFLHEDDMSALHLTLSVMLKVALPRYEGPHSASGQRGRVHPEQTAGRGRPQTRRVRGMNRAPLLQPDNEMLDDWQNVPQRTVWSILRSSAADHRLSKFKCYLLQSIKMSFNCVYSGICRPASSQGLTISSK